MAKIKNDSNVKSAIKATIKAGKTQVHSIVGYKGLELRVRLNADGTAAAEFRHRYTHPVTGKRPYMTLGHYPPLTLADAKQMHSDNIKLLARNIDPLENKEADKLRKLRERNNDLNHFISEWQALQSSKQLSDKTQANNAALLEPIINKLGHKRVTEIEPSDVIKFITDIQKTAPSKGLRVKALLYSILQIAKKHRVIETNPASDLKGTLLDYKAGHQPAITELVQFAKLLNDIDNLDDDKQRYNKAILQLLSLTFARIGDVCAMRWADVDLDAKQWTFTPQKTGNRDDMSSLIIPLSPQALSIIKDLEQDTGGRAYVFYNGRRKADKHHDRQQVNKVLNSELMNDGKGYKGIHTPHGFRAAAKTLLSERLGYDELLTELSLGHSMPSQYGKAYNRAAYIEQRTELMSKWADYLDNIKAGKFGNVIHASFKPKMVKQG